MNSVQRFYSILFLPALILSSSVYATPTWTMIDCNKDMKHGDCHLLTDRNINVLVDAATAEGAEKYLVPYLKNKGITLIDHFIISHPHTDHYEGLKALNKSNIKISNIYFNYPPVGVEDWDYKPNEFQKVLNVSEAGGSKLHDVKKGQEIKYGDSIITVLEAAKEKLDSVNDYSIIMRLVSGGYTTLFTGDLDHSLGSKLAENPIFSADFYKAPHHGVTPLAPNSFSDTVSPILTMVPTSKELWSNPRSNLFKEWVNKNSRMINCSNGLNGTVKLSFMKSRVLLAVEHENGNCKNGYLDAQPKEVVSLSFLTAAIVIPATELLLND